VLAHFLCLICAGTIFRFLSTAFVRALYRNGTMEYGLHDPTRILQELPALTAPVLHGFIALWGLLDCFFGFKIFRATLKILTAFAFAVLGASIAARLVPDSVPVFVIACAVGLILGFIVGWYIYKASIVAMAMFGGFVLAAPFVSTMGANAFLAQCGVAVAAGILAFFLLEPVVIVSMALTGAYRVVFGLMFFMGGQNLMDYISGAKPFETLFTGAGKLPMLATLLLAAAGGFVQFASWRSERAAHGDDED
jgi:hypothetical protein